MSGKISSIGHSTRLRDALAYLAELESEGYDAVLLCAIKDGEEGIHYAPALYGRAQISEVVFACERIKQVYMREIDEE